LFIKAILLKQNKNFLNIVLDYKLSFSNCKKLLYSNNSNCVSCIKIIIYSLNYSFEVVKQKLILTNNTYNIAINLKVILNNIISKTKLYKNYIIKNKKYSLINKVD